MIFYEDLRLVNQPFRCEIERAFSDVLQKGRFVLGENVSLFEQEFSNYLGVRFCIGVGNGLDALALPLRAWAFP